LIEQLILPDYRYIRNDVSEVSTGMPLYHSILTGIALGDGKTHTAFKRANVSQSVGQKAVDELCELGIIKLKKAKKASLSDKLYFNSPFLRFWFAFISPLFKGVKEGDFKEVKERFLNRQAEFTDLIFEQLSQELIQLSFKDDTIYNCSSYWDESIDIPIYAKTKSGKIIAGECKYTKQKLKKSTLTKLQQKTKEADLKVDIFVLISKNGFSSELKALKGDNLKLFTIKSFKKLLEDG
jgi:hypothetical protein